MDAHLRMIINAGTLAEHPDLPAGADITRHRARDAGQPAGGAGSAGTAGPRCPPVRCTPAPAGPSSFQRGALVTASPGHEQAWPPKTGRGKDARVGWHRDRCPRPHPRPLSTVQRGAARPPVLPPAIPPSGTGTAPRTVLTGVWERVCRVARRERLYVALKALWHLRFTWQRKHAAARSPCGCEAEGTRPRGHRSPPGPGPSLSLSVNAPLAPAVSRNRGDGDDRDANVRRTQRAPPLASRAAAAAGAGAHAAPPRCSAPR